MKLDKCNAYTAKEILGYSRRKSYVSAAREEETSIQLNYRSPPIRRKNEPIEIRTEKMKKRAVTPIDKKQKKQQAERKLVRKQSGRGEHKKRLLPNKQ